MKKNIRLFITALIVLITFLFINISKIKASTAINSYEEEQGLIVVGTYEKIEREEVLMKIQITEDMKEYYDEHNIPYITETRDLKLLFKIIHTYEYYYTYVSYYDDVVSEKYVLKNDIQSVIYLVQVLEDFANDYIEEKRSEMENPPEETAIIRNRSITNLILGYIRGINLAYCRNGYFNGLAWHVTAGEVDYDFVDYVNLHDSSTFKIRDYFARFVDQANYNSDDYGTISGTEVTSGLGSTISVTYNPTVTIHANKTRLICLGLDSPTSSIQDYTWTSENDYYAQVSSFGTIFANHSGTVTISGINKYNSRYRVSIIITII